MIAVSRNRYGVLRLLNRRWVRGYSKGSKCRDWMPSAASPSSRVRTTFSSGRVGSPRNWWHSRRKASSPERACRRWTWATTCLGDGARTCGEKWGSRDRRQCAARPDSRTSKAVSDLVARRAGPGETVATPFPFSTESDPSEVEAAISRDQVLVFGQRPETLHSRRRQRATVPEQASLFGEAQSCTAADKNRVTASRNQYSRSCNDPLFPVTVPNLSVVFGCPTRCPADQAPVRAATISHILPAKCS